MSTALHNKRILVTRARSQAKPFSERIRCYGGIPIEVPLIHTELPKEQEAIERIKNNIERIHDFDWLIFTSANGVRSFFTYWERYVRMPITALHKCKIAAVGPKTMAPLKDKGIRVDVMPDVYEASHLFASLKGLLKGTERILLARGNLAKTEIVDRLRELGCETTDLVVYETKCNEQVREQLYGYLQRGDLDVITFTSPSTVQFFVSLLEGTDWRTRIDGITIACIGTVTRDAAIECGMDVHVMPQHFTVDDLLEAIAQYYQSKS